MVKVFSDILIVEISFTHMLKPILNQLISFTKRYVVITI